KLREDVMKEGGLTENVQKRFGDVFGGNPNSVTEILKKIRAMFSENPESLDAEALKARNLKCVLDYINEELISLGWSVIYLEKREYMDEAEERAASVMPIADKLDMNLRYETMLDRQFQRAMHQLERLQRMRKGETVPPPLTMEVSHQ
ncbi:MAG: hypothetical protein NTY01_08190, partial [Verrucomicrobia bacterium]|nr:hypothetical protein [Verrucomicrobiota bacterium]